MLVDVIRTLRCALQNDTRNHIRELIFSRHPDTNALDKSLSTWELIHRLAEAAQGLMMAAKHRPSTREDARVMETLSLILKELQNEVLAPRTVNLKPPHKKVMLNE